MIHIKKVVFLIITLFISSTYNADAQNNKNNLTWEIDAKETKNESLPISVPYRCIECYHEQEGKFGIPYFVKTIDATHVDVKNIGIKNKEVVESSYSPISTLKPEFQINERISYERGKRLITFELTPIRKAGNKTEYITSFEWDITTYPRAASSTFNLKKKKDQTYNSVLASGDNHKIKIPTSGVYKIDFNFLASSGIDASSIELSKFKIYGNGGEMLPELIATPRPEDLLENAIYVYDQNGNNKWDGSDYVLWYANGPTTFRYEAGLKNYTAIGHDFDVAAYYFLNWEGDNGKRISNLPSGQGLSAVSTLSHYDHLIYHEKNEENHIKSGRRWWGDKMQINRQQNFNHTINGAVLNEEVVLKTVTCGRSYFGSPSSMSIRYNGTSLGNFEYSTVDGDYDKPFASNPVTSSFNFNLQSKSIQLTYNYNKTLNEAAAWIDYYTIAVPRKLGVYESQQIIRTDRLELDGMIKYPIEGLGSDHLVWNISNKYVPANQETYTDGSLQSFISEDTTALAPLYIIFDKDDAPSPTYVKKVASQNLHQLSGIDYIMISHPSLVSEAERLSEFHKARGLDVAVVTTEEVFNEFSSGSQDVTGIRDFIKLIYDRGQQSGDTLRYVLMFGDGSYDYKDVEANNTNLVPIYQSYNSNDPTHSYCSDDYYAILSDSEGYWGTSNKDEDLDIFIGRLPVSNEAEAKIVVDKILHYHSPASRGNWMQTLTFVADDENSNAHIQPSENMVDTIQKQSSEYNIKKIWLDAYKQVSFGSGNKFPEVNEEITKMIGSQGTLIFNYVGHGGENGMAHERVVTRPEIQSWTNYDKLAFYITASCELAKIDNLEIESPGELMLLNPNGGAIGLLATTRVVYIGLNTDLNAKLLEGNLLLKKNGKLPSLGEAYLNTRNRDKRESTNARCFILLADPAMSLLSPNYRVVTTEINGQPATSFSDTLKALELVTISGEIRNENDESVLSSFNGELFPTFYDKPSKYRTLGQDDESYPIDFEEQNRIIYKGNVSVQNGKFSFKFVVPKDIAYNVDNGKLSYYAKDAGLNHAGGVELSYKIGGTADSIINDDKFDELKLYLDDEDWVFGGITSPTPNLFATLSDSNGINTIGSGIGREMEAILDKGTDAEKSIVLNDFYRPDLNSYQSGKIEYPFEPLSAGRHTLSLKVWDVYNNSAEAYTEFVVSESEDITIANVLNYPNPFNKNTVFHFDHNKAGQEINVNVIISSVAGNVVKSITQTFANASSHSSDITWDGRDDYGDNLAKGVYIYTLTVAAEDGSKQSKTEKLYIIN